MMSGIRAKNTRPELIVRKGLHRLGFRFRLHGQLPGKPDLVFPKHDAVIFVHGCFWHGHDCPLYRLPSTRPEFWRAKIARNQANDLKVLAALRQAGWRTLTVWECALRGRTRLEPEKLMLRCARWLRSRSRSAEIRG
jgi:DNA mismatch endonuclease (patch repair protein)